MGLGGKIGIVWNLVTPRPARKREEDVRAAERTIAHETRMFTDPVLGKGYPKITEEKKIDLPIEEGDLSVVAEPIDFIGLNYYTERPVAGDPVDPHAIHHRASFERATEMGWPVVPEGLLRQLRWMNAETGGRLPLYIMENGSAENDVPVREDGKRRVHDPERVEYIRKHLEACSAAIREGIPLKGYFVWSFIDNFEWSHGYRRRFGIVYCDYANLERIPKDSYYFYRDVIAGHIGGY
jgi:beta-glucosidase